MQKPQSNPLPGLVRFGAAAGIFFVWMLFEKQIIEPFGIYRYMPFYRIEGVCAWDVLVAILITVAFVRLGKRSSIEI
jgi:hypothetical protein